MSIDNSFNMVSFNLGMSADDTELLLASFHKPIQEFLTLLWQGRDADAAYDPTAQKQADAHRIQYGLNVLALEQVIHNLNSLGTDTSAIRAKLVNCLRQLEALDKIQGLLDKDAHKRLMMAQKQQALKDLVEDPAIAPHIQKIHLDLLDKAKQAVTVQIPLFPLGHPNEHLYGQRKILAISR